MNLKKLAFTNPAGQKLSALVDLPADAPGGLVALIGIPFDENSSFMRGPAQAPGRIRAALHGGSANLCAENGLDLESVPGFIDLGDLDIQNKSDWIEIIVKNISSLLDRGARLLSVGGDHAITYPIIKAYSNQFKNLNILQLDAHPDLYDQYQGNRYSHACPFARIMENVLARRLVQVGIRTLNAHQRQQARRFGVEIINMGQFQPDRVPDFNGPLYLSIDLDVLDPAFAPGVSHHEPGGMSTREVIQIIQGLRAPLVGADIVEFNPRRDVSEITAMAAAKLLKEVAAAMIFSATGKT